MARIGYFLGSEEHSGPELVEGAVLAERAGFDGVAISDHFSSVAARAGPKPVRLGRNRSDWAGDASSGGAAAHLHDRRSALVVRPDDPGALAAAVERLQAEEPLRATLRAAGRRAAEAYPAERSHALISAALEAGGCTRSHLAGTRSRTASRLGRADA